MKCGKSRLKAVVIEYWNEKSPMRNDFTKLAYPYVQIKKDNPKLTRLKYADSVSKPFEIGAEVEVFWYEGILYYWHAYDKGLYKFLTSKWSIWNKDQ